LTGIILNEEEEEGVKKVAEKLWEQVLMLNNLQNSLGIAQDISENSKKWKEFIYDSSNATIPEPYEEMHSFSQILLCKLIKQD
jgi:hypothetical protein